MGTGSLYETTRTRFSLPRTANRSNPTRSPLSSISAIASPETAKDGPLPPEAVGRIYQKLVEEMRNWEANLDAATVPAASVK
jgi:hypothetical protein